MSQEPVVPAAPATAAPLEQDDGAAYGFSAVFQQAESSRKISDREKERVFDRYKDLDFYPQIDLYLVHEDLVGETIKAAWSRAHDRDSVTAFNSKRKHILDVGQQLRAKKHRFWQKWARHSPS